MFLSVEGKALLGVVVPLGESSLGVEPPSPNAERLDGVGADLTS